MKISLPNVLMHSNRKRTASDVEEELRFHVEMLERKYAQQGRSDPKAAALKRFGNLERVKTQCVDISRRNSFQRRIFKAFSILIALTGLAIKTFSVDYRIARVGGVLIMIAIGGRLLLYVRGLSPWTFLPGTKPTSLSVFPDAPDDGART